MFFPHFFETYKENREASLLESLLEPNTTWQVLLKFFYFHLNYMKSRGPKHFVQCH